MSEGKTDDLRRYLPGRERARELADTDAAEERIAAALEDPGLQVARASKSQEPAPVAVPKRPAERPRRRRWTPAVVSTLGALAVLLPAGLAIVLFSRPPRHESFPGEPAAATVPPRPPEVDSAHAGRLPEATAGAVTSQAGHPMIEPSEPAVVSSATGAANVPPVSTAQAPGAPAPLQTAQTAAVPAKPRSTASPKTSAAPNPLVLAPPAAQDTPSTAPPEPTGSAPRYTDPDF